MLVELRSSVKVPEPVTLLELREAVNPDGDTVLVRLITLLNPCIPVTVMVELPVPVAVGTVTLDGLAAMLKSCTSKVTIAECDSVPLVPVTVTVYESPIPEQDNVDVPDPDTLGEESVQVRPVDGEIAVAKFTDWLNP
jgi:hypothetical protein